MAYGAPARYAALRGNSTAARELVRCEFSTAIRKVAHAPEIEDRDVILGAGFETNIFPWLKQDSIGDIKPLELLAVAGHVWKNGKIVAEKP